MDSDSSLDENFETKVEVAARIGRTESQTESPQAGDSGSESSLSSDDEEREVQRELSVETSKSPVGGSNSILSPEDDAQSQSSFTSSSSINAFSRSKADGVANLDDEREQDDGRNELEGSVDKFEAKEEDGECETSQDGFSKQYPTPADEAGDLSDVSEMDSRDSLEAVFAQDCKVKDSKVKEGDDDDEEEKAASAMEDASSPPAAPGEEEDEEGLGPATPPAPVGPRPPSPPPTRPPLAAQHLETEQLDFEAEEQVKEVAVTGGGGAERGCEDREEGECEEPRGARGAESDDRSDDGELREGEDLEEGELTDEDEARPGELEPRPVCRFYNRGQCTWGSSCRFVHPGVTDKGNYSMFELPRALLPVNGPPVYSPDYRIPYEKPFQPVAPFQVPRKEEIVPVFESAWERGLRHAKEMMRKATKRKEMDVDFEEKKMNLSLGQEELDKENDYYTRPASPVVQAKEDPDHWSYEEPSEVYHAVGSMGGALAPVDVRQQPLQQHQHHHHHHSSQHGGGGGGGGGHPSLPTAGGDYWRRVHYEGVDARSLRVEAEYVQRGIERKERPRESRDLHRHHHHHHHHHLSSEQSSTHLVPSSGGGGRGDHHHRHHAGGGSSSHGGRGGESSTRGEGSLAPPATERSSRKKASAAAHANTGASRSSANAVPLPQLPPEKPSVAMATAWRDEKYPGVSPPAQHSHKARGDEWADPWMRSKSPTRRSLASTTVAPGAPAASTTLRSLRHHRHSFSSGSSYSSSTSSSRSSSRSSYSSFSSRSRSRSPRTAAVAGGALLSGTTMAATRPRHSAHHLHRHVPPEPPLPPPQQQTANHHQPGGPPAQQQQGLGRTHHHHHHHHRSAAPPRPSPQPTSVPRTPPLPAPHSPPSKSRSRSPLSRAHRRRVSANAGVAPPVASSGAAAAARGQQPPMQISPRHSGASVNTIPPRKLGRISAPSPSHGERKVGSSGGVMLGGGSGAPYNLPPPPTTTGCMLAGTAAGGMVRGGQGAMVRDPSPQLVRKALHATAASIPMPQPSPRMIGTTRAPQAAVAVAAAAAKSATEPSSRHHRRRHDQRGRGGHGRRRSSAASHRSQSSSRSSRSDDDDDDNSGSGSSSDSSDSSGSSTSSTSSSSSTSSDGSGELIKKASPQVRPKRFIIDDRAALANSMKVKAMDALKLSGQKQQIKLTLKAPGSNLVSGKRPMLDEPLVLRNRDRLMNLPLMAGKKRPAPDSPPSPTEQVQPATSKLIIGSMPKASAKKAPSRREELLKQLKAVEDAIARKRSKITFPGTS